MTNAQAFLTKSRASSQDVTRINGVALTLACLIWIVTFVGSLLLASRAGVFVLLAWVFITVLAGIYVLIGLKLANQWEKAVVLRFGKFSGLKGPGMFWIVPIVDNIAQWIDHRVMVSPFSAEKTLTKDTVPVDVDAVLFWLVWDAEKAAMAPSARHLGRIRNADRPLLLRSLQGLHRKSHRFASAGDEHAL